MCVCSKTDDICTHIWNVCASHLASHNESIQKQQQKQHVFSISSRAKHPGLPLNGIHLPVKRPSSASAAAAGMPGVRVPVTHIFADAQVPSHHHRRQKKGERSAVQTHTSIIKEGF